MLLCLRPPAGQGPGPSSLVSLPARTSEFAVSLSTAGAFLFLIFQKRREAEMAPYISKESAPESGLVLVLTIAVLTA